MDEPAAGLPEAEVPDFAAVVRSVRDDHGAGVLLIDHNMALIMDVCDRIHVLDQGMSLAEGTPAEIRAQPRRRRGVSRRERRPRRRGADRMTALVVEDLEVRYGAVRAVRGLSFTVEPGEIVGLIGPNGAGKSSTLHAIMGAAPVAAGDVRLGGASLVGRKPEDVARSGIALVPEGRRIFGELTVEENLRLGLAGRRSQGGAAATRSSAPTSSSRSCASSAAATPARSPAASSSSSRSRARSSRSPTSSCSTSRRSGSRRASSTSSSTRSPRFARRGLAVLLVEQRAQRTVALADRSHVLVERRAAPHARPRRRGGHREARGGVLLVTLAILNVDWQTLADALALGAVYALMAVGIGLVFGVLRLVNFAYGQLDHGRRVRARLRVAVELAGLGRDPLLLRGRARAVAAAWTGSSSGRCARSRPR